MEDPDFTVSDLIPRPTPSRGQKSHICEHCNKNFFSSKGLLQHQIIHTDQKPFVCNICNKAFRFKSNLFEHRSLHSGALPYTCPLCEKSCRLKGNLKKHLKTHIKAGEEFDIDEVTKQMLHSRNRLMESMQMQVKRDDYSPLMDTTSSNGMVTDDEMEEYAKGNKKRNEKSIKMKLKMEPVSTNSPLSDSSTSAFGIGATAIAAPVNSLVLLANGRTTPHSLLSTTTVQQPPTSSQLLYGSSSVSNSGLGGSSMDITTLGHALDTTASSSNNNNCAYIQTHSQQTEYSKSVSDVVDSVTNNTVSLSDGSMQNGFVDLQTQQRQKQQPTQQQQSMRRSSSSLSSHSQQRNGVVTNGISKHCCGHHLTGGARNNHAAFRHVAFQSSYHCSHCSNFSAHRRQDLLTHVQKKHPTLTTWFCKICLIGFDDEDLLDKHRLVHERVKQLINLDPPKLKPVIFNLLTCDS